MKYLDDNRVRKVLPLLGFAFIVVCLYIIISSNGAENYEISIYETYAWYFWWLIVLAIFTGQVLLIINAFSPEAKGLSWLAGFLIILLSNAILLLLPFIRGYAFNSEGDQHTHIGYIRDILREGYIGKDFYPLDHIAGVTVHLLTGITLENITFVIPIVFSFLLILSMFIFYKYIFDDKFQIFLGLALSSLLLWGNAHTTFKPNFQAFFLMPLGLYIFLRRHKWPEFSLLGIIFVFFIMFCHPIVAVLLVLVMLIMDSSNYIFCKINNLNYKLKFRNSFYMIMIILVTFFIWEEYAIFFAHTLEMVYLWLIGEAASLHTDASSYFSTLQGVQLSLIYIATLAFYIYGINIITSILSIISIFYLFKIWKYDKHILNFNQIFSSLGFIAFIFVPILNFFFPLGFSINRTIIWEILFFLILIPSTINHALHKTKAHSRVAHGLFLTIVFLLIFILTYLSVFTLYPSPLMKSPGLHVTHAEIDGIKRFFEIRNDSIYILELAISQSRFYDELYGVDFPRKNIIFYEDPRFPKLLRLPDHFGYNNKTLLGFYYDMPRYLILTTYSRILYPKIYPEFINRWRYTPQDFNQLEGDASVKKIYNNQELTSYLIY